MGFARLLRAAEDGPVQHALGCINRNLERLSKPANLAPLAWIGPPPSGFC
jgi:hypothetical protein